MNCKDLNLRIFNIPNKTSIFKPIQGYALAKGCDNFTPDCYWFINGDLVCRSFQFNYIFYKPGSYILTTTIMCGECLKEIETIIEVS